MPIFGRKPKECFDQFEEHVRGLVAAIMPGKPYVAVVETATAVKLSFLAAEEVPVAIETRVGRLYLWIAQVLRAIEEPDEPPNRRFRLSTWEYAYRLQASPGVRESSLLRWEYKRPGAEQHCRHHVHVHAELDFPAEKVNLKKLHLPTGWVTLEELFRFLIYELGMRPACGDRWSEVLAQAEERFYKEFTSKRYTPPGDEGADRGD